MVDPRIVTRSGAIRCFLREPQESLKPAWLAACQNAYLKKPLLRLPQVQRKIFFLDFFHQIAPGLNST